MASPVPAPALINPADLPCFRCTFTHEFHDTVLTTLAKLAAGQETIVARLDKINGSVGELYKRTNEDARKIAVIEGAAKTATEAAEKALSGVRAEVHSVTKRVTAVEKAMAALAVASKTTGKIMKAAAPLLWGAFAIFLFLVLKQADAVVKAFFGKG